MPERPFRWGILSAANIARRRFVPGLLEGTEGQLGAVAARDGDRARAFASEFGIPRAYDSYDALLEDPEVDGVYIGLPNSLHAEWTVRAAAAGKHVLCEKPLARRAADVDRMAAACAEAGVLLMEAFMYRHHPQHARVRELVASGEIGEPAYFRATFSFAMDAERRSRDVRVRPDLDGGAFMDVGCYTLNAARFLFDAEPIEVTALQRLDPALGVDTTFAALAALPRRPPGAGGRQLRRRRAATVRDRRGSRLDRGRPVRPAGARCGDLHRRPWRRPSPDRGSRALTSMRSKRTISCRAFERAGCCRRPRTAAPRPGRSRRSTGAPRPARPCGSSDRAAR